MPIPTKSATFEESTNILSEVAAIGFRPFSGRILTMNPQTQNIKTMKKRSLSSILFLLLCVVAAQAQIKTSSGNEEYWYNLLSAQSGVEGFAIVENPDETAAFPLTVAALDNEDPAQQWKFVESGSKTYYIVNRKSGKQIIANSTMHFAINATQLGSAEVEHKGFKVTEISEGQYAFSGVEDDKIERYLALQDLNAVAVVLDKTNLANSAFAWAAVLNDTQGIQSVKGDVTIQVKNRRIIVENAKNYKVTSLAGVQFAKKAILEPGIYVVTINGESTNVYVK